MKNSINLLRFPRITWIAVIALFFVVGCGEDTIVDPGDDPVASFQFTIDGTNFLTVTFSNFSQNATSHSWDFGDGNTSTDESPTHTYAAAGVYTVTLTATNSFGSDDKTESVTLMDPNEALAFLAGTDGKTWYLDREGIAMGIGPVINDNQWWSFGGATPLGDRPCIMDDKHTFNRDGSFVFESNGTIFIDADFNGGWLDVGVPEGCHDESEAGVWDARTGEDVSDFADGGDYTYEYDAQNNTLALLGSGAYIGLPNKTAAGDNYVPISFKEYTIFNSVDGDLVDSLGIALAGDGFAWNFYLVSYKNESDIPEVPGPKPSAAFSVVTDGFTVTTTNNSKNSTSYMWDFGDGGMSSDFEPSYTYGAEGEYTITLTVMDDMGNMDMTTQNVTVSAAEYAVDKLSSVDGKVWKLAGEGSYKVGPSKGSGEWWGGLDATGVAERACQMDDEFIFFDDGTFVYDSKGGTFAEPYMGGPNACVTDAEIPAPYDVFGSGTHAFETIDGDPMQIKTVGMGAFIGFNKGFNGGELDAANGVGPASEITYDVFEYAETSEKQILTVTVDISGTGTAFWTITIESPK